MTPVIEILVIGYEILSGKTRDSNAEYLINSLSTKGFTVNFISVAGDKADDLAGAFRTAVSRADIVLATGGLGPTSDDITVSSLAGAFDCKLVLHEGSLRRIEELFRRRNRFMSQSNKKQAYIPEGAEPVHNTIGSAPGVKFERNGCTVFLMPGVPVEMQKMVEISVLPWMAETYQPSQPGTATVSVTGISESELYDRISHLPGAREAFFYYPGPDGIVIRIQTGPDAPANAAELRDSIVSKLGDHVFSTDGERIEDVVGRMLIESGLTVGVAESCTGGYIADRLTNIPGSSNYFLSGVVAYSNESKHRILGVDTGLIERHGAVSVEVAGAMAEGIRAITGADIGVSTTGIAGPGGGSAEKPVGLLYIGLSSESGTETKKLQLVEDRLINKRIMSQYVMNMLRLHVKKDKE